MIVLDSSFLIAFHNSTDVHHSEALPLMGRILDGEFGRPVLLEYVFLEVVTVILLRRNLTRAVSVAEVLLDARELEFVACSELFLETFRVFRRQETGRLSFVDCAVLAAARRQQPSRIVTFDQELAASRGIEVPSI